MVRLSAFVPSHFSRLAILISLLASIPSCGPTKDKPKSSSKKQGAVDEAFTKTAQENKIPKDMMLAVAFLESGISPIDQSTPYYNAESARQKIQIGTTLTETAFGITRKTLGLTKNKNADDLKVQIAAYGKWVKKSLDADSFKLKESPSTGDEKYWWLWKLAQLHRNGDELTRNIRVVWTLNMINILNAGFVWQDPNTGDSIELAKASPPVTIDDLQADAKRWLQLEYDASDISNARMFELTQEDTNTLVNVPNHIEVIHCPLSLSGCLELQDTSLQNNLGLGAHYVIPQDDTVVPRALQIAQHQRPVMLTNKNGEKKPVTDAIVIMLVGNSGQYVDGIRVNSDPTWFTAWQLKKMGAVISGVCKSMAQSNGNVNSKTCQTPDEADGVHIQHQGLRAKYRWGDVPDFDKSIFYAYLKTTDHNIEAEVTMQFDNTRRTYRAGKDIEFTNLFHPGVRYLRLQRAVRCDDKQLVWETIHSEPILENETTLQTDIRILDAGPNANGRQFLRVLVHDQENKLSGWAISDLFVTDFDPNLFPPAAACFERDGMEDEEEEDPEL